MPLLAGLIPILLLGLRIFLLANLAGFVVRLLFILGFSFLVLDPINDQIMGILTNKFGLLPHIVAEWIKFLNFDRYVSIIMSAMGTAATTNFVLRMNPAT